MSKRKKSKPSDVVTERIEPVTPEEVAAEIEDRERKPPEPPPPEAD